MHKVKVIIASEKIIAERINKILEKYKEIEEIKIIKNDTELYMKIKDMQPDLLFLDNDIKNGTNMIEKLFKERQAIPYIILLDTNAIPFPKGFFSHYVIDSVIKPFTNEIIRKKFNEYINYKEV